MNASVKWMFPFLMILALITLVPAGYAWEISRKSPLLPVEAEDSLATSKQAATAGAGPEPIVLAAARNIPAGTETPKPKKARKAKGPAPGNGCGPNGYLLAGDGGDLDITDSCKVGRGTYNYRFVYIRADGNTKGSLTFDDATIDFWAKSILVENEGSLIVGSFNEPIGKQDLDNTVTFHLYGADSQKAGITCKTTNCGVDAHDWTDHPDNPITLPSGKRDYFYKYKRLPADDNKTGGLTKESYFGLKTLAVSYGGTLQLFGRKGAEYQDANAHDNSPGSNSGESWVRLNKSVVAGGTKLVLDRTVDTWQQGDWIVVTATDYIPNHSEMRQIDTVQTVGDHTEITLKTALTYPHNGEKYDLAKHNIPERLGNYHENFMTSVDTRAAVALLSRGIRIVSNGDDLNKALPSPDAPGTGKYFGGHVIARQGFKIFQMKGVELKQLGQGGRMAHSPVNFHMARKVATYGDENLTYVTACSVNESMTRMYEIRGTQGVILKRNVGYKSIGHGYFLAEGTETGNHLEANIGIYARPAVDYRDNPRKVPGVLAKTEGFAEDWLCPAPNPTKAWCFDKKRANFGTYGSDYIHPSVFYITNGYNSFEDNMAVGAGTCGACYWLAPARISGLSKQQSWKGYASIQKITPGTAPLFKFHGNFCSTAQHSLITIDSPGVCNGVCTPDMCRGEYEPDGKTKITSNDRCALQPVKNPFAWSYDNSTDKPDRGLWTDLDVGAALQPNICDNDTRGGDCSGLLPAACGKGKTEKCAVSVIDSYTSSFHWAQQNYAAIWLRTNWFLFTNSALTDVLNGGLTMVSGGSWDQVINKYWALTRKSVFIGNTQEDSENIYAQNWGPVNQNTKNLLKCQGAPTPAAYCRIQEWGATAPGDNCGSVDSTRDEGVVIPISDFSVYQRLYNIYDGPVYQESNAYVNIMKREVFGCDNSTHDKDYTPGTCRDTNFIYWRAQGIPKATEATDLIPKGKCIMPSAAIGWKQPNGFYYPPAFHSKNLFFDNVDIRHFVIVPLFKPGTFDVDVDAVKNTYCTYPPGAPQELFSKSFTDIDRQTELNDDDGSLSGLSGADPEPVTDPSGTISVNKDQFYYGPKTAFECLSEQSCYQSPYDYVTAVVYPNCAAASGNPDNTTLCGDWKGDCTDWNCYGVPIYRQYLNAGETFGVEQGIRMLGTAIGQRSTMIANNGKYYIDTAMSPAKQGGKRSNMNVFYPNHAYNFFLTYAKPTTKVTFQLYVGHDFNEASGVEMVRVGTNRHDKDKNLDDITVLVQPPLEFKPNISWPEKWSKSYNSGTGILEVTMDLSDFKDDFEKANEESCGPASFCEWKNGECGCKVYSDPKDNPIGFTCEDASKICAWSSHRSECPSGGCIGFQVKLPPNFEANDNTPETANPAHRPVTSELFPSEFTVDWVKAPHELSYDWSVQWDHDFYPAPGPCDYNNDPAYPKNAPLPSSK